VTGPGATGGPPPPARRADAGLVDELDRVDGWIDLHCHYLPGIDDGVRTLEEGVALCQGLGKLGFGVVVATPHIRTAMFENRRAGVEAAFAAFQAETAAVPDMPRTGLGAEHFFDDVVWSLLTQGEHVPYPGGRGVLLELHERALPLGLDRRLFELRVRGVDPVLAHPERYAPFQRSPDALEPLLAGGTRLLLDVMSLVGKYGRAPKRAAERMLADGAYFAACSDSHKPRHLELVDKAIRRLRKLVGPAQADALLGDGPRALLRAPG